MALSIKSPEVERLARRLAKERHLSITGAIKMSLQTTLGEGDPRSSQQERDAGWAAIKAMQRRIASQGIDWSRTDDDIMGYDENGLPA